MQGSNNWADSFIHFSYLCLILIELTVEPQYQNGKEYGVEFVFVTTEIAEWSLMHRTLARSLSSLGMEKKISRAGELVEVC